MMRNELRSLHIHLIIRLNCAMSWEPKYELMNAEMCVDCYFYMLKAAILFKSLVKFILYILAEFILIHPW